MLLSPKSTKDTLPSLQPENIFKTWKYMSEKSIPKSQVKNYIFATFMKLSQNEEYYRSESSWLISKVLKIVLNICAGALKLWNMFFDTELNPIQSGGFCQDQPFLNNVLWKRALSKVSEYMIVRSCFYYNTRTIDNCHFKFGTGV